MLWLVKLFCRLIYSVDNTIGGFRSFVNLQLLVYEMREVRQLNNEIFFRTAGAQFVIAPRSVNVVTA